MSQKSTVLAHLKLGQTITALEAVGVYGIYRLAARIDELRNDGFLITTEMKQDVRGKSYASYSIHYALPSPVTPSGMLDRVS